MLQTQRLPRQIISVSYNYPLNHSGVTQQA